MKKIYHIDCTLRDGGYYNLWNFEESLVQKYLECMEKLNIDFVEIGFRFLKDTSNLGLYASTTEKHLSKLKISKNLKLATMINIGEFDNLKLNNELDKLFLTCKKSKISLVRIATHKNEVDIAIKASKILKKKGYLTAINLMQISEISKHELSKILKKLEPKYLDIFYFADSLGSLNQKQTIDICKIIKKYWKKSFGIHAHDNMEGALQNTVVSYEKGANYLDSTILGMGRGPGNTKTELLCSFLNTIKVKKYRLLFLTDIVDYHFAKLKKKYMWGTNLYYYLSAKYKIHPTYIQNMLSEKRYEENEIMLAIENLKLQKCKSFSPTIYKNSKKFLNQIKFKKIQTNKFQNRKILILANGPSLKRSINKINNFIKINKPIIITLNFIKDLKIARNIDYLGICHPSRIISEIKTIPSNIKLITPFSSFNEELKNLTKNFKKIDYGLKIEEKKFDYFKNYCVLEKILVLPYILSFLYSSNVKSIFFAGLDGYENNKIHRREINKILRRFKFLNKRVMRFLTPTLYKI